MKRRARFSAERVANAQVRQLEEERRVRATREVPYPSDDDYYAWVVGCTTDHVEPADRIRLLYGLSVGVPRQ